MRQNVPFFESQCKGDFVSKNVLGVKLETSQKRLQNSSYSYVSV